MHRIVLALCFLLSSFTAQAGSYLIENVRIFNGVDASLKHCNVLVLDVIITTISADAIAAPDS